MADDSLLQCAICTGDYSFQEPVPHVLVPCGHTLHQICIAQWQRASAGRCPLCNQTVDMTVPNYSLMEAIGRSRDTSDGMPNDNDTDTDSGPGTGGKHRFLLVAVLLLLHCAHARNFPPMTIPLRQGLTVARPAGAGCAAAAARDLQACDELCDRCLSALLGQSDLSEQEDLSVLAKRHAHLLCRACAGQGDAREDRQIGHAAGAGDRARVGLPLPCFPDLAHDVSPLNSDDEEAYGAKTPPTSPLRLQVETPPMSPLRLNDPPPAVMQTPPTSPLRLQVETPPMSPLRLNDPPPAVMPPEQVDLTIDDQGEDEGEGEGKGECECEEDEEDEDNGCDSEAPKRRQRPGDKAWNPKTKTPFLPLREQPDRKQPKQPNKAVPIRPVLKPGPMPHGPLTKDGAKTLIADHKRLTWCNETDLCGPCTRARNYFAKPAPLRLKMPRLPCARAPAERRSDLEAKAKRVQSRQKKKSEVARRAKRAKVEPSPDATAEPELEFEPEPEPEPEPVPVPVPVPEPGLPVPGLDELWAAEVEAETVSKGSRKRSKKVAQKEEKKKKKQKTARVQFGGLGTRPSQQPAPAPAPPTVIPVLSCLRFRPRQPAKVYKNCEHTALVLVEMPPAKRCDSCHMLHCEQCHKLRYALPRNGLFNGYYCYECFKGCMSNAGRLPKARTPSASPLSLV